MSFKRVSLVMNPGRSNSKLQTNTPTNLAKNRTQIFRGTTAKSRQSIPHPTSPKPAPLPSRSMIQPLPKPRSQPTTNDIRDYFRSAVTPLPTMSFDEIFDEMVDNMQVMPINEAIEKITNKIFHADISVLWLIQEENFFSPSKKITMEKDKGILSNAIKQAKFWSCTNLGEHSAYDPADEQIMPKSYSVIVIPILNSQNEPLFLLQIGRDRVKGIFGDKDFTSAITFMGRLQLYGPIIFDQRSYASISSNLIQTTQSNQICQKMEKYFKCRSVEVYCYKPKLNQIILITSSTSNNLGDPIPQQNLGFASPCIRNCVTLDFSNVLLAPDYNPEIDGTTPEAVIAIPYMDSSNQVWACVLRGPLDKKEFTLTDETVLAAVFPFAAQTLRFVFSPPQLDEQIDHFEQRLKALLEVAEILSGVLDIDLLLPTIMDRACKLLNAERCSLFLVDNAHHELVTRFHGGLDNAIHLKIGRGIVGSCAESGETVNIRDAYADQRFDRSVDLATGFTTRSLLCIPIYNNRGEITGVTEMINKKDEGLFDEDDEKMLMAFNVFCGISLDNARLYRASLDLTRQLRSFIQMSVALNAQDTIQNTLEEIMNNIRSIVNASRVTIFLINENDNQLFEHLSIGDPVPYGSMFAKEAVSSRKFMLFDHREVLGRTQTQQLNKAIERILAAGLDADLMVFGADSLDEYEEEEEFYEDENGQYEYEYQYDDDQIAQPAIPPQRVESRSYNVASRATNCLSKSVAQSQAQNQASQVKGGGLKENNEVICCLPMISSDSTVLGVIELSCNWKVMSEDIKLLDCFSVFAAVSIERSQLKDRAKLGQVDAEMKNWISEKERTMKGQIPSKLLISMDKLSHVLMVKFDAAEWDGIRLIKVIFAIFDLFDLMNFFNITNEKLFKFLFEIKNTYNKVPYHNWRHAVDVTQFCTYEILAGGLDSTLTKFEIFGLLVSAICHDANHDGFSNVYNVKAETPLGILFKNQSVMETHHCSVAIGVITKEECNIFSSLSSADNKQMWVTIISLILATDMAKHFDLLKAFNTQIDNGEFSMENQEDRIEVLQMLLKCGDVSNVARPFEIADKWSDMLCEEFFRQGDLEKASGMEYTSALNDREHLDKPKSQIGFYTFVCLPLFEATARAIPKLQCNVTQLLTNLENWKSAQETKNDDT